MQAGREMTMVNRYMALHDTPTILAHLSDADLLTTTAQLAERERHTTADLISALMEIDARKLYLGEGCSSLFTYCTQVLHFSEHAADGRIARALEVGPPRPLFRIDNLALLDTSAFPTSNAYVVAPNGERFLVAVAAPDPEATDQYHCELARAA